MDLVAFQSLSRGVLNGYDRLGMEFSSCATKRFHIRINWPQAILFLKRCSNRIGGFLV
jgi:hypothetical protein